MPLTADQIREAAPGAQPYELRDTRGLVLRVFPSGCCSWRVKYRERSGERNVTIGHFPDMGLEQARAERDRRRLRRAGRAEITLEEFATVYLEHWAKPRNRSWRANQRMLERDILPAMVKPDGRRRKVRLGDRPLSQITRSECAQVTDAIIARGAPEMAAKVHACLRRVLNYAVERGDLQGNPCVRMKVRQGRSRDRALRSQELAEWWPVFLSRARPGPRIAASLILATLQRPGEVLELEHADIDRIDHLWTLPSEKAKNRHTNVVPLTPWALSLIREARALWPTSKRVVPISAATLRGTMSESWQAADIDRVTPHDLRRTGATWLGYLGVSRTVQDKILNHVDKTTGGIYDRYEYLDEKRQALEAWAERFRSVINDDPRPDPQECGNTGSTRG